MSSNSLTAKMKNFRNKSVTLFLVRITIFTPWRESVHELIAVPLWRESVTRVFYLSSL